MRCFGRSNRVRDAEVAGLNLKITQLDEKNKLLEEMKGLIEDESNLLAKELRKSDEHVTLLCRELCKARIALQKQKLWPSVSPSRT